MKVACPACTHVNDASRLFCGQCGGSLGHLCEACSFTNLPADRFCGGCGEALRASPSPSAPTVGIATTWEGIDLRELFEPFTANGAPDLPVSNIGQADVDRLFGES